MPKPAHSFRRDATLALDESLLHPGLRLAVGVSGGADSVALLRALLDRQASIGLVLSVIHIHHGIRGSEADEDQAFVEALATSHGLAIHVQRVDTPVRASSRRETLEEAARHLRYEQFAALLQTGTVDAIATAHTLDDQAETVLHKFLRGAWTEGLGGISPVLTLPAGRILRPLLAVTREDVETSLRAIDQPWREDATNRDLAHTRNRLRHHLLPILKEYNPQLALQLSRLATIARDEEAWWQREVARVGKSLLLPGKPVRGGGRSSSTHPDDRAIAFELERLRTLDPAMRRRILRWAASEIELTLDFDQTTRLMQLCAPSSDLRRVDLAPNIYAQRTVRELQMQRFSPLQPAPEPSMELRIPGMAQVPGTAQMEADGLVFEAILVDGPPDTRNDEPSLDAISPALIRKVQAGDRVTLRHTSAPKKVKELFERLHIPSAERDHRRVVSWKGHVIWLEGVDLDPASLPTLPFRLRVRKVAPIP